VTTVVIWLRRDASEGLAQGEPQREYADPARRFRFSYPASFGAISKHRQHRYVQPDHLLHRDGGVCSLIDFHESRFVSGSGQSSETSMPAAKDTGRVTVLGRRQHRRNR
jgi:hypothetical protein